MPLVYSALAVLAAYLLGSLSFAVIVSRLMGLNDPRTFGSKNPGATNVLRSGSKAAAILTLVLDAAKGWLPVALVRWFGAPYGMEEGTQALVALAAFVGHLWPVFFAFKGGKGVATALGVLLGISVWLGLATLLAWLVVVSISRYVSLSSMAAAVFAPTFFLLAGGPLWYADHRIAAAIGIMAGLLVWRHQENMVRLLRGTESKLGQGKDKTAPAAPAPVTHPHPVGSKKSRKRH